jgi:hypothetical protein
MAPAECNYGIHDKEILAIIRALQEYIAELEGLQRGSGSISLQTIGLLNTL